MRENIQRVCQTSLPLGKCVDLVFEDVDVMNNEIAKWKQQVKHNKAQLMREHKKTVAHLRPLYRQLHMVQQQIQETVECVHVLHMYTYIYIYIYICI